MIKKLLMSVAFAFTIGCGTGLVGDGDGESGLIPGSESGPQLDNGLEAACLGEEGKKAGKEDKKGKGKGSKLTADSEDSEINYDESFIGDEELEDDSLALALSKKKDNDCKEGKKSKDKDKKKNKDK